MPLISFLYHLRHQGSPAETPIMCPLDVNTGKDCDAGKHWRQKEKRETEDEMVGGHHRLKGCELGKALGDNEGQGSLVCCSPWGHRVGHGWVTEKQQNPPFSTPNVPLLIFTISADDNFFPPRCWSKILLLSILPITVNVLVISFRSTC